MEISSITLAKCKKSFITLIKCKKKLHCFKSSFSTCYAPSQASILAEKHKLSSIKQAYQDIWVT